MSTGRADVAPVRAAMELLGDRWTLLILQSVFLRIRRYADIAERLRVSPSTLSARLRDLVASGLLVKVPYRAEGRAREEYRLTERGRRLWALLVAIWMWERTWIPARSGALPTLTHIDCGAVVTPLLGCASCDRSVDVHGVKAVRPWPTPVASAATHRRFRRSGWDRIAGDPLLYFAETMELLGDRWTTGLLVTAFLGAHHFTEFQRELDIPPSVLSARLTRLVDLDVLAPVTASTKSDASGYRLTAKGRAFFPNLAIIISWVRDNRPEGTEMPIRLDHDCGRELEPVLLCDNCQMTLRRERLRFTR